jgi:hypothetical protein
MKDEQIQFSILLRGPKYPAIVISAEDIWPVFDLNDLGTACYFALPLKGSTMVSIVDVTGEEFLYMPDKTALMPGIGRKKWTKKQIIELFNNSETAKDENIQYPSKSISNKRLDVIFNEICGLLSHNNGFQRTPNGAR